MGLCYDCGLGHRICVCDQAGEFMEDNDEMLEDLKELEEYEKSKESNKSRCLACFFFDCRCKEGLANKKI